MRTTLDIDDDVLAAAKELASGQKTTAGKVISDLVRKALTQPIAAAGLPVVDGFPILPHAGKLITVAFIDKLLEEDI
jgi:hypothetical protein